MAFQPVPNAVEVVIAYTLNDEPITNILHAEHQTGQPTEVEMQALVDVMMPWIEDEWMPQMPPSVVFQELRVRGLTEVVDNQAVSPAGAIAGTATASTKPNNVTKAFTLRSPYAGKSGRGRLYVPAIPDQWFAANENYISETWATSVANDLDDLIGIVASVGFELSIVSRVQNKVVLPEGVAYPITSIGYSNLTTDSMRSRLPKG